MHVISAGQIEDERAQEYCQIWALHIRQRIHNASIKEFHFSEGIEKKEGRGKRVLWEKEGETSVWLTQFSQ